VYYYRIRALALQGPPSPYSNEASGTQPDSVAPSGLVMTSSPGIALNMAWNNNATDTYYFKVERKTGIGGTWSEIGTAGINAAFGDLSVQPAITYYYRVRAVSFRGGTSAYSNETSGRQVDGIAPTDVTVTSFGTYLLVTWTN